MSKQTGPYTSDGTTIRALARAIGGLVQTDGDHNTSIPALTLHRRSGPTEPLHCIYNLGLGVVAQGDIHQKVTDSYRKHVDEMRDAWKGQSAA